MCLQNVEKIISLVYIFDIFYRDLVNSPRNSFFDKIQIN